MEDWFINQKVYDEDKIFILEQHLSTRVYEKYNEMQWRLVNEGKSFVDDWDEVKSIFRYAFLPLHEYLSFIESQIQSNKLLSEIPSTTMVNIIEGEGFDKKILVFQ